MDPGMMAGRAERFGDRTSGGMIREEKKIGKREQEEAEAQEKASEPITEGHERMAEHERMKGGRIEEKMGKERAEEGGRNARVAAALPAGPPPRPGP